MRKHLKNQLLYAIDLRLPGFEESVPPGSVRQLAFTDRTAADWFAGFVDRVYSAIGRKHFPIYRMADGEFIFCVGWRPELPPESSSAWMTTWAALRGSAKRIISKWRTKTLWGERYTSKEKEIKMTHFKNCIQEVAEEGCLALHFTRSPEKFAEQYFDPMYDWFEANGIPVTLENYMPFYFVYALLSGPERYRLFSGRRVLVVTSADSEKRKRIAQGLKQIGAQDVQFTSVSPYKSLMDKLDLSRVSLPVDVALIAAGIGSVNVLCQLKLLNTVCIDAGICVEALADPSLRIRLFMVPDDEGGYSV